jgi:hypothetical protein
VVATHRPDALPKLSSDDWRVMTSASSSAELCGFDCAGRTGRVGWFVYQPPTVRPYHSPR